MDAFRGQVAALLDGPALGGKHLTWRNESLNDEVLARCHHPLASICSPPPSPSSSPPPSSSSRPFPCNGRRSAELSAKVCGGGSSRANWVFVSSGRARGPETLSSCGLPLWRQPLSWSPSSSLSSSLSSRSPSQPLSYCLTRSPYLSRASVRSRHFCFPGRSLSLSRSRGLRQSTFLSRSRSLFRRRRRRRSPGQSHCVSLSDFGGNFCREREGGKAQQHSDDVAHLTRTARLRRRRRRAVVARVVHDGRPVVVSSEFGGNSRQPAGGGNAPQRRDGADVVDADVAYLTRTARLVQWYPGHIAKAERDLKQQLKLVDLVIEVRDARIPLATTHPDIDRWIGEKLKMVVLNRQDMVSSEDRRLWTSYYCRGIGEKVLYTDGQHGVGILQLQKAASGIGKSINSKRKAKGLLPRAVRAAVIGFPNVGKSALINRLLKRRACESAPRPGVTRTVRWVQIGEDLDLMDAPGVLPMRIADQAAAVRLAICNDIGEASYAVAGVAAVMIEMIRRMPSTRVSSVLKDRYNVDVEETSGEELLEILADKLFGGDVDVAAHRVLKDYRRGALGKFALERPPKPPLR